MPVFAASEKNDAPKVIPAVREWTGGKGQFVPKIGMKISVNPNCSISNANRELIKEYFFGVNQYSIDFTDSPPSAGDIYFCDADDKSLGSQGYTIDSYSILRISANDEIGFVYAMITFLQSVMADGYFPNGFVRDLPQYSVRSGMIDVSGLFVPLDYLSDLAKYLAWFKMNEIHIRINGASGDYSAFRLESNITGLTSTDGYYTKDSYRSFQNELKKYHIDVVTEISTPSNSESFANISSDLLYDDSHLDISKKGSSDFVCKILDEYISGKNPVFVNKKLSIGIDDYSVQQKDAYGSYLGTLMNYCSGKGFKSYFWGSFGENAISLPRKTTTNAICNFWSDDGSASDLYIKSGYDVVNSFSSIMHFSIGGKNTIDFPDYEDSYKNWFVNFFGNDSSCAVSSDHKRLAGASFALWTDYAYQQFFSKYDLFDRLRYLACFTAEKTWTGDDSKNHSYQDYMMRFDLLSYCSATTNPGNHLKETITTFNCSKYEQVGYPYLFSADVIWNRTGSYGEIASNDECTLFISESGNLCYKCLTGLSFSDSSDLNDQSALYAMEYSFPYQFDAGKTTNIKLYAEPSKTYLLVDDCYVYEAESNAKSSLPQSSSFILPLSSIGSGNVSVSHLSVTNISEGIDDLRLDYNVAIGKTVSVGTSETDGSNVTGNMAVDGNLNTAVSLSDATDNPWLLLDLGKEFLVSEIEISFTETVSQYEVSVSSDGISYTKVFDSQDRTQGDGETVSILHDSVRVRYIRYNQLSRYFDENDQKYRSSSIAEIFVNGFDVEQYDNLIHEADAYLYDNTVDALVSEIKTFCEEPKVYSCTLNSLYSRLENRLSELDDINTDESNDELSEDESFDLSLNEDVSESPADSSLGDETSIADNAQEQSNAWIILVICFVVIISVIVFLYLFNKRRN